MTPLNPRQKIVLKALTEAADKGAPCPSNIELSGMVSPGNLGSPYKIMDQLEYRGLITIVRGTNWRVVTITETGKSTHRNSSDDTKSQFRPRLRVVDRTESAKLPVPPTAPVFRDPCPWCATRMDADPAMCCAPGRAYRKLVA